MTRNNPYASDLRIRSKFVSGGFLPDGDLNKPVWQNVERVRLDHDWAGRKAEVETQAASLWSATRVYVAFWCGYSVLNVFEDEDPATERWGLWERDVVEVFLNPDPACVNHYYEFEVAPTNQWVDLEIDLDKKPFNDAAWDSRFEHETRIHPERHVWTCEMSIPVASMDVGEIQPSTEWRVNFYRADGSGNGGERCFLCWSPTRSAQPNFHVPRRFGILQFVDGGSSPSTAMLMC